MPRGYAQRAISNVLNTDLPLPTNARLTRRWIGPLSSDGLGGRVGIKIIKGNHYASWSGMRGGGTLFANA